MQSNLLDILKYKSAASRVQPPQLESAASHSQLQDGISLKLYPAARSRVSRRLKSAVTRIQPSELKSAWDKVSRNSYPDSGTRVNRRMESAVTRVQPPELGLTAGLNQSQLIISCVFGRLVDSVSSFEFSKN